MKKGQGYCAYLTVFFIILLSDDICIGIANGLTKVALYTFHEDSCRGSAFTNTIIVSNASHMGDLVVNNISNIECLPKMGISMKKSSTESIFGGNAPEGSFDRIGTGVGLANSGITIEIWFKTPSSMDDNATSPILTIARNHSTQDLNGLTACDQNGYDLQVSQRSDLSIEVNYRTNDPFFEACQRVIVSGGLEPGKMTHLVISLRDRSQTIDLNGQRYFNLMEPFADDLRHWITHEDGIFLMRYPSRHADEKPSIWHGNLYQLAFYAGTMTQSDVIESLKDGLVSTGPFAFNQTITINEDAENVPASHGYEWYFQEKIGIQDSAVIEGPQIGSIEQEVQDLLQAKGLVSETLIANPIYVYLTKQPLVGKLYKSDGVPIDAHGEDSFQLFVPLGDAPVNGMVYIPPHNEHSESPTDVFASFSYCISSVSIFDASQCESSGEVSLIVLPVNDPPVALEVSATTVSEGSKKNSPSIALLGWDVDNGDFVNAVQITQFPNYGKITLSVPSFRKDGLIHGTPITDMDNIVYGNDPVYVKYHWEPTLAAPAVQGKFTKDFFQFRVQDTTGAWSNEKTAEIQIISAVEASIQLSEVTFNEDSVDNENILQWIGEDYSGHDRVIRFFVEKVPSEKIGVLVDASTKNAIHVGSIVEAIVSDGSRRLATVLFQPVMNFCDSEKNDSDLDSEVVFRAVALAEDTLTVVSASNPVFQKIHVACTLDVLSMSTPFGNISILETNLKRSATDPCYGANYDPNMVNNDTDYCLYGAVISGIEVISRDLKSTKIMAVISTTSGYLTLNKYFWELAEPIYGRRSISSGNVTFYAFPEDLNTIFSNLHYGSFTPGQDSINIELRYGDCTETELRLQSGSFQTSTCQVIRNQIRVNVLKDPERYKAKSRIIVGFPWQIVLCIIGYPALYVAVVYLLNNVSNNDFDNKTSTMLGSCDYPLEKWIQHTAENGMFFYENTEDGYVTWQAPPPDEDCIRHPAEEP